MPSSGRIREDRSVAMKRLALLLVFLPLLIGFGGWCGYRYGGLLAVQHPSVMLDAEIRMEELGQGTVQSLAGQAFQSSGRPRADLRAAAANLDRRFQKTGGWVGALVGLLVGARMMRLSVIRYRPDYEPDRSECLSCGRCFMSCPREHVRRGLVGGTPPPEREECHHG
jgi:hypothetical protein